MKQAAVQPDASRESLLTGRRPSLLDMRKMLRAAESDDRPEWRACRLAIIASFTFDLLDAPLRARAALDAIRLETSLAPYGQYAQWLVDPGSPLHTKPPDALLFAVRPADVHPDLYTAFNSLTAADVTSAVEDWRREIRSLLTTFRERSRARLLLTNYETPAWPALGYADLEADPSQVALIAQLNAWLRELARELGDAFIIDVDALAARVGRERYSDPRLERLARCPISAEFHWDYAGEIARVLRMISGKSRKVLAIDCDNTLWGGVLGDLGRDGIALGQDFPGNAYRALQQRVLELQRRGVVLVIASKNDRAAVLDVFHNHPEMVLRPEHVACFAVDWNPKPENLRRAAETLNLGVDSFVFIDDHPVECQMMRELLPEVLTIQLPEDPAEFERVLARLDVFDQPRISEEDRRRGALYREDTQRAEFRVSAGDLESFYRGLQMTAVIRRNDPQTLARAAQLTQRTNQFNMTTIRRTPDEIQSLVADGAHDLVTLRLIDRFGDNGIVGLAIVRRDGALAELDSFLMSCRVLGRTVEQMFLTWLCEDARSHDAARMIGLYVPTPKNRSFGGFYGEWGMTLDAQGADGEQRWSVALERLPRPIPAWFTIDFPE